MKWINRERPKIDRIACPWLIKKLVDRDGEFIYVPKAQVFSKVLHQRQQDYGQYRLAYHITLEMTTNNLPSV
jgi:hypothetical protein